MPLTCFANPASSSCLVSNNLFLAFYVNWANYGLFISQHINAISEVVYICKHPIFKLSSFKNFLNYTLIKAFKKYKINYIKHWSSISELQLLIYRSFILLFQLWKHPLDLLKNTHFPSQRFFLTETNHEKLVYSIINRDQNIKIPAGGENVVECMN